jgi:transposase
MCIIKYEIGLSFGCPRVIWLSGPYKNSHDATIVNTSTLKEKLQEGERVIADKSYRGSPKTFICPITSEKWTLPREDQTRNYMIYSARNAVERVISRIKNWGFLKTQWRYSIELHALCMKVACKLVNLFLLFEPLG